MSEKPLHSPYPEEGYQVNTCWTRNPSVLVDGVDDMSFPGPLLNREMDRDELVAFIHDKCQEIVQCVDKPDQKEEYIFWNLMELFLSSNRKVLMADIASRLIKAYSSLRKKSPKLLCATIKGDWCLPLARLLYSASPEDELHENIILMADDLACSGRLFASHICCVVAQLELGSYPDSSFDLIGCASLPRKKTAIREAMQRSEVYEYVMFMTSGSIQARFQKYKAHHAQMLADEGHPALALDYCKSIARAIIKSPSSFNVSLKQQIILLSEKLLQWTTKKPEWLLTLSQSRQSRLSEALGSRYDVGQLLGEGGFGSVYAGVRRADGKLVAIKHIAKTPYDEFITIPGETDRLPLEVALMKMVSVPPVCENIVELLEWMELPESYILVLERPSPCMDLRAFRKLNNGQLAEPLAQNIMRQVVHAVRHCFDRSVFHSDIKEENLLINTETLQVKLIDFGCGHLLTDSSYRHIAGTPVFWPPEWTIYGQYMGRPATLWSLGVLMYRLTTGILPFRDEVETAYADLQPCTYLSLDCQKLIYWCLEKDADHRATIDDIAGDKWLQGKLENNASP